MVPLTAGCAAPPRAGVVDVGPIVVRRRCTVPSAELGRLDGADVWDAAALLRAAVAERARTGALVADRLAELVPTAPPARRRDLLRWRRTVHGGGVPDAGDEPVLAPYRASLDRCRAARADYEDALRSLNHRTASVLARVVDDPDLARSIELSVPGLDARGAVGRLRDGHGPADLRAKERRRVLSLFRLAQRAATKPTPFARFVETTVVAPGAVAGGPSRSVVRTDRAALDHVAGWIRRGGHRVLRPDALWLTTNPTATVGDGAVTWVRGHADVARAPFPPPVTTLLERLRDPMRLSDLTRSDGLPRALAGLVAAELLEIGTAPPGDGRDPLDACVAALAPAAAVPDGRGTGGDAGLARDRHELRAAVRRLRRAERRAGTDAGSARREASAGTDGVVRVCGGDTAGRSALTEDLVGEESGTVTGAALDGATRTALHRMQSVVGLLNPELPFVVAGAIVFGARFGDRPVPAVEAFRWYLEHGRGAADELLADCRHPRLAELMALRDRLIGHLTCLAVGDADEVDLDAGFLDRLAADLPGIPALDVASWFLQHAGGRVVLNGVGPGRGRFAARVGTGLSPAALSGVRDWAACGADRAVDLPARFGATANEHPVVLPGALAVPGRALECPPDGRIDVAHCTVTASAWSLRLHDRDGRRLSPSPHNATLPQLAPPLYRWLCRTGPPPGAVLGLWDDVDARDRTRGSVRRYPRLTLGPLVVCRRTWVVPAGALPPSDPGDVAAWHAWSAGTGVPRRSFVRTGALPSPWDVVRGRADRRGVDLARRRDGGAGRKPAYVDLAQPWCHPTLTAAPDVDLTFTEVLPDPLDPPSGHVTEFVVETALTPEGSS